MKLVDAVLFVLDFDVQRDYQEAFFNKLASGGGGGNGDGSNAAPEGFSYNRSPPRAPQANTTSATSSSSASRAASPNEPGLLY